MATLGLAYFICIKTKHEISEKNMSKMQRNKPIIKYATAENGQRGMKLIGMKSQKIFEKKYAETR